MIELIGLGTLIFALFIISGIVSGAETALFSLKPHDLEHLSDRHPAPAKLLARPRRLLIVILFTNMIVNTMASSLIEVVSQRYFTTWSVLFSIVVGTFLTLIFGEVGPKATAIRHNIGYATFTAPIIRFLAILLKPFTEILLLLTRFLARKLKGGHEEQVTEEDIKSLVSHSEDIGALDHSEEKWIHSIFELDKKRAADLMTPKDKMFALPREIGFDEALATIHKSGYSRVPLYAGAPDQISGVLYARDLLIAKARNESPRPLRIARRPLFVPRWKRCDYLLNELRSRKTHLAIVVDEFGNTSGIITLEDILEAIVGDIRDRRREGRR